MAIYFVILSFLFIASFSKVCGQKNVNIKTGQHFAGDKYACFVDSGRWVAADYFSVIFLLRFRVSVFENIQFFIHRMIYTALSVINLERTTKC